MVGAGFTGLVAAYELRKRLGETAQIVVADASDRIGGSVRPVQLGGARFEAGAESFLANSPDILRLADELGLAGRIVSSGPARPSVFAARETHPLPTGTYFGLPSPETETALLGPEDLAAIREDRPADWDTSTDMSIAELVEPVYGPAVRARLVDPLLSGVYAGDSFTIGVRAGLPALAAKLDEEAGPGAKHVSLTRAVAAARSGAGTASGGAGTAPRRAASGGMFRSFDGGLGLLLDALLQAAGPLDLRLGEEVTRLERTSNGYAVDPVGEADAVVLAVGSHVAGALLACVDEEAGRAAASIPTASPVVLALRCERLEVPDGTSGVLVASGEGLAAKALTLTANKWPHLSAPVLRVSFGRYGDDLSFTADEQLLAWAASDFTRIFGKRLAVTDWTVQRYPEALPQYGPWHSRKVAAIASASAGGLAVAGNFLRGVGLGACAATAAAAAEQIANVLEG
ncbi:protoporphyrinogen oxidase [Segniliparus rugosus ATCC BAA-974]|uniref:Coproporphyrinogen III oxidase n=1 Tax=Segniliparus rugosus (strain ATCC BAA-974 / DSM 45345 / CCUG 50838 / CIP 108380 / JCM 13579 / CDC 945) TaxID=679197 RepID=E5XSM5_SEGRC|nr:protoporphyrinogen oxidase [Segniliparus rugosus ATCC BAA-974]